MLRQAFIGIDPGVSGGLACITSSSEESNVRCEKMPNTEQAMWEWFRIFQLMMKRDFQCYAVIEQVSGWMGGNVKADGSQHKHGGAPGSAMFKFGQNYGTCRGMLIAAGFVEGETLETVHPRTWQSKLGIEPKAKGEKKEQHKRKLKEHAIKEFNGIGGAWFNVPISEITLATCDALLLARYCMMRFEGSGV